MDVPIEANITHDRVRSYLDSFGRYVVRINAHNTHFGQSVHVRVGYDFPKLWMLHEPLLIAAGRERVVGGVGCRDAVGFQ